MVVQRALAITRSAEGTVASSHIGIDQGRRAVLDAGVEDRLVERRERMTGDSFLPRQIQVRQCSHYTGYLSNISFGLKAHGIEGGVELVGLDLLHRGAVAIRTKAFRSRVCRKTTRFR